jgi:hypothetical protein
MLEVGAGAATVRTLPGQTFHLVVLYRDQVLQTRQGRTDQAGRCEVPLSILGVVTGEGEELSLRVTVRVRGEDRVRSSAVVPIR